MICSGTGSRGETVPCFNGGLFEFLSAFSLSESLQKSFSFTNDERKVPVFSYKYIS